MLKISEKVLKNNLYNNPLFQNLELQYIKRKGLYCICDKNQKIILSEKNKEDLYISWLLFCSHGLC